MKEIALIDEPADLAPNSVVHLNSTECFSLFELFVLLLWHIYCMVQTFQMQQFLSQINQLYVPTEHETVDRQS